MKKCKTDECDVLISETKTYCEECLRTRRTFQVRECTRKRRAAERGEVYVLGEYKHRRLSRASKSNTQANDSIKPWMLERGRIHYEGYIYGT